MLDSSREQQHQLPPPLDLSGDDVDAAARTQFASMLAWEAEIHPPDPGPTVSLRRYTPIDVLQIPEYVNTRADALEAIRLTERLCSLIWHQSHCVKNPQVPMPHVCAWLAQRYLVVSFCFSS